MVGGAEVVERAGYSIARDRCAGELVSRRRTGEDCEGGNGNRGAESEIDQPLHGGDSFVIALWPRHDYPRVVDPNPWGKAYDRRAFNPTARGVGSSMTRPAVCNSRPAS